MNTETNEMREFLLAEDIPLDPKMTEDWEKRKQEEKVEQEEKD